MAENDQDNHDPKEQPLVSHLVELRDRILRSLLVVLVVFVCLYAFKDDIYTFVAAPLNDALPAGGTMIATSVTSTFFAPLKLTAVLAVFISIPFLLYQIWAFISPGLYKNEIKIAYPILISSIFLFYIGVAFAYLVVFKFVFPFFAGQTPDQVIIMPDITSYLDLVLAVFLVFGLVFEIPIATILLIVSGATTPAKLSEKRPYIIIGCFVVAMFLTPADPISLFLLAVPMWMLFETGIFVGRILHRADDDESAEENKEEDASEE